MNSPTDANTQPLFQRVDAWEVRLCLSLNALSRSPLVLRLFRGVSRLGDGLAWYLLMLVLPLVHGLAGLGVSLLMAITGVVGLCIYRLLKQRLVRRRPFVAWSQQIHCGIAPLDEFSFPSGHSLHAAAFTYLLLATVPALGLALLPFAVLVAASRVVLGLHYPTDVLVGVLLGVGLAQSALWLLPGLVI